MTIVWKPDYETGHPIVDFQHRQLFKAFLAMREICASGKKDRVEGTLNFLVGFTDKHVQDTNASSVTSRHQYPFQHSDGYLHEKVVSFISELENILRKDGPSPELCEKISCFVEEALTNLAIHIHKEKEIRMETELSHTSDGIPSEETPVFSHVVPPPGFMQMPIGFR